MMLRFKLPIQLYILGPTRESLEIQTTFLHEGLQCRLQVIGPEPLTSNQLPEDLQHFRMGQNLEFTVEEGPADEIIQSLVNTQNYSGLVKIICTVANSCIRAMRNFGWVPHLRELLEGEIQAPDLRLRLWSAEVSQDNLSWTPISPPPPLQDLMAGVARFPVPEEQAFPELRVNRWPEIEEAIQDHLPVLPEQEFTINAIEHLRIKNFRLALVESTIGLEIVLHTYLSEYLRIYKGFSKTRIDGFLNANLHLSNRLAGLLDLTLAPDDLQHIDLNKVRKAVRWRNDVVHKKGRLPEGIPNSSLEEAIFEVLNLTQRLGNLTQKVIASPEIQAIANHIYECYGLPRPIIRYFTNHMVGVEFEIFRPLPSLDQEYSFPTADSLNAVIVDLSERLRARDARFMPEEHLIVLFFEFPRKMRARWHHGVLEFL